MEHKLPALPYTTDALQPFMSKETLEYHYGKHHQTYVTNLNNLTPNSKFATLSLEDIVREAPPGPIFNNAAQVWNHTFFWHCLKSQGGGKPGGNLIKEINKKWNDFAGFEDAFTKAALANFGSGWTWLVKKEDGSVDIENTSNAATPLGKSTPLLTLDVWEHAYYIDHRNRRADFVKAFLNNLTNWSYAEQNYD